MAVPVKSGPETPHVRGLYFGRRRRSERKTRLEHYAFSQSQRLVPTLLIPIYDAYGEQALYQHRPDEPRVRDGKRLKYETCFGSKLVIDVPPLIHRDLGNPKPPLVITEGSRKADAAVSAGLCCISLLGVWGWRGTNDQGGKTALAEWEAIALNGRVVNLCFDSDVIQKREVYEALRRLKGFVENRGAEVRVTYLPSGDGGAKVGLETFWRLVTRPTSCSGWRKTNWSHPHNLIRSRLFRTLEPLMGCSGNVRHMTVRS